jgi:2-aminoadipate transaminase
MERLLSTRARTTTSSTIRDLLKLLEQPDVLSLAGGLPAAETFPVARMREAAQRVLGEAGTYGSAALQYGPTEGVAALREWVAAVLPNAMPEQALITTGSQQGLDLVFHALVDPGDAVVVEAPSYVGALQALEATSPELVMIPMDGDGLRVDVLAAQLRAGLRPKCLYTVPNFQNPTGATLSYERRVELAALADRYGFLVVEDDPYGVLRFRGSRVPLMRTMTEHAVTLGTVSKLLAPGLRVGWVVGPEWLFGSLVKLKQARDLHTSSLSQHVAADVLSDETFMSGHLARLPGVYRTRADALYTSMTEAFGERLQMVAPDGGMFLWGRFDGLDTNAWLQRAVRERVAFVPGTSFHRGEGRGRDEARFSFATLTPAQLAEAVGRLRAAA